jgi:hypothetical protein
MEPAAFSDTHPPARHWEKRVLVAYLRMMGLTQHEAGKAVGRAARTVRVWEADTVTWAQARGAAEALWLGELTDAARQTLLAAIRGRGPRLTRPGTHCAGPRAGPATLAARGRPRAV